MVERRDLDFPFSQKLLAEAEYQQDVALDLKARYPSAAVFHALMAIELADKCLRELGATFGSLAPLVESGVLDKLLDDPRTAYFGPQPRKTRHHVEELLDRPWLRGEFVREAGEYLGKVRAACAGLDPYEASRYPDKWPADSPPPHQVLTSTDAENAIRAAAYHVSEALLRSLVKGQVFPDIPAPDPRLSA